MYKKNANNHHPTPPLSDNIETKCPYSHISHCKPLKTILKSNYVGLSDFIFLHFYQEIKY